MIVQGRKEIFNHTNAGRNRTENSRSYGLKGTTMRTEKKRENAPKNLGLRNYLERKTVSVGQGREKLATPRSYKKPRPLSAEREKQRM